MSKKMPKLTPLFVPAPGTLRQALLFPDARTDAQAAVCAAADGTRTLAMIARFCSLSLPETERIVAALVEEGELREATGNEMLTQAEAARQRGQFEIAIGLLQRVAEVDSSNESVRERLGDLLAKSARPAEAAAVFHRLAGDYTRSSRLGEALSTARRAAELQPGAWNLQNALAELCLLTGRPDEAARVWRACACRLAGAGQYEQALGIIDSAELKIPGNDILFYAEAEILSALERSKAQETQSEKIIGTPETPTTISSLPDSIAKEEDGPAAPAPQAEQPSEKVSASATAPSGTEPQAPMPDNARPIFAAPPTDAEFSSPALPVTNAMVEKSFQLGAVEAQTPPTPGESPLAPPAPVPLPPPRQLDGHEPRLRPALGASVSLPPLSAPLAIPVARRSNLALASYALCLIAAILVGVAAYTYQLRERMHQSAEAASGLLASSAPETLYRKKNAVQKAQAELATAQPPLEFLQTEEYRQQVERTRSFANNLEENLRQRREEQARILREWEKNPSPMLLPALRELTGEDDPESPYLPRARELYRLWMQTSGVESAELSRLLETLRDTSRPTAERFAAYAAIAAGYPAAFRRNFPDGCRDLSVPTEITAVCGHLRESLPLRILLNGQELKQPRELPLDPAADLRLIVPGFRPADPDNVKAQTNTSDALPTGDGDAIRIPRPFTSRQIFVLEKTIRWSKALPFRPEAVCMSENSQQALASGSGQYQILNTRDGELLRTGATVPVGADLAPAQEELQSLGDWIFCRSSGGLTAFSLNSGQRWNRPEKENITGFIASRLTAGAKTDVCALVLKWNEQQPSLAPLSAIDAHTGKPLWPTPAKPAGRRPARPLGAPFQSGWHILYLDVDGMLHVTLENGQEQRTLPLPGVTNPAGAPLFTALGGNRTLLVLPEREKLCAYLADLTGEGVVTRLWEHASHAAPQWMEHRRGILYTLDPTGATLRTLASADGQMLGEWQLRDLLRTEGTAGLSADPVLLNEQLLLPVQLHAGKGKLLALRLESGLPGAPLWELNLPAKAEILSGQERTGQPGKLLFSTGSRLYLLEN